MANINLAVTPHSFRAAAPQGTVLRNLGALADLPGTWMGNGFNLISLPLPLSQDPNRRKIFRLKLNATHETLSFTEIGAPIPNRGFAQDDIAFLGVHYFQQVSDAVTNAALHLEPGMWLNLPITTAPAEPPTIVRLATIPHGDAMLAQSDLVLTGLQGGPKIDPVDSTPFTLNQTTGARQNETSPIYLDQFTHTALPPGIPVGSIANPNLVISNAIRGQNITNTVVIRVNATPIGGINGTPIAPPSKPNNVGGIVNIPFVNINADANSFSAIFWVETVENSDGTQFLQLQYTQTAILDFDNIKWPHISVATLVKQ
ncbi:MAG: hypothetical protein JO125_04110 [Chloroflexi bacterium]|nr:hypothetical protein [Ktedonobacteraceae bacterium]MBV8821490.1 hypothetical protein [Ktedonobacteraceae bacterium]MBV9021556.1 hypothetical protein [Ktedonobacteraceae bacterium]MBV9706574.1 hypothetical protein [Chloroflexota bacterium]